MRACLQQLTAAAWRLGRRYPYFAVALPVVAAVSIAFLWRDDSEWEAVYVVAANHLRQGVDIYTDGNAYPPFGAFTALPASFLPRPLVRATWLGMSLLACVAMVRGAWHLAGGGALQGKSPGPVGEHVAAVLGCLCGAWYLQNCFAHQQNDLVIGTLLVIGCLALQRGRSLGAATCFGLAAALKCTALLWFPYLLWRGRHRAALWLIVVAVGVNLLPDLISSPPSGRLWLQEFATRYLLPLADPDHVAGTWASDIIYNQSIAGTAQRWLVADRDQPVGPHLLRAVVLGVDGAVVLVTLLVCGAPFRNLQRAVPKRIERETAEFAVVLTLMLLLSPMSSKAHFGVLIVPGFILARAALTSGSRFLWGCLLPAFALSLLSNKDPLGEDLYSLTLWYGTATWESLFLLVGCLTVVWRLRRGGSANTAGDATVHSPRQAA
jgi:hypothetical protein